MGRVKTRNKKNSDGRRSSADRRFLPIARNEARARMLARRAMVVVFLAGFFILAGASTLNDRLQHFVNQGMVAAGLAGGATDNLERAALLRRVASAPDAVRSIDSKELALVFGTPALTRAEAGVTVWQYTSPVCALDVYYKSGIKRPVYAEYRVAQAGAPDALESCVRALFISARTER